MARLEDDIAFSSSKAAVYVVINEIYFEKAWLLFRKAWKSFSQLISSLFSVNPVILQTTES
jgi:hypothetical protein